jgi:hypothetical protein
LISILIYKDEILNHSAPITSSIRDSIIAT